VRSRGILSGTCPDNLPISDEGVARMGADLGGMKDSRVPPRPALSRGGERVLLSPSLDGRGTGEGDNIFKLPDFMVISWHLRRYSSPPSYRTGC
jgi:hypothetical protein